MANETIIPMREYLLLSIDNDTENKDSLIISYNVNTESNKGIVKAIGDKVNTDAESTQIKVNDKVIFVPGSGIKLTNSEDSDVLISVKNIIGIIKGE